MICQSRKNKSSKLQKTCVAILPAAGSSTRMKESGDKLFIKIRGIPVIIRTLLALERAESINAIIIPTREDMVSEIESLCKEHSITKVIAVIPGGSTRAESVLNGVLKAGNNYDLVAIHDAARPFISQEIIEKTISAAGYYNAAAPAVPMKDTIKSAKENLVISTVPRETIFAIQTPQIFDAALITGALTKAVKEHLPITDDCSAVEAIGMRVFLTKGDYMNIKITTPEDLIFAEAIASHIDKQEVRDK